MNTALASSSANGTVREPARAPVRIWSGRILSALPVLAMIASAALKLSRQPGFVAVATDHLGYTANTIFAIGVLEVICVALYVVPRTAVIGAILLTAYLGGAVATHVRVGDPFLVPIVFGLLVWGGLYLRDERLRELTPLRASTTPT